jgi:Flp pilus assembly protein TadD
MLSTLLGKQPASDEARFALASLYCRIGRGLEAGEILGEVSAGFRVRAAYHNLLGRIASREGDSAHALEEVRRSVALEPENEDYITDAALELALAGRMDEARKVIEKARKDLPSSGRIVFAQGVWLELAGLRKESAAAYRQAADLSWHWQAPYLALGNVLRELGSPKDALEELNQAESLFTASPWPHWLKALALTKSGADSESQSEFTRALDLASNQPEIFPALLASSLRRGDCGAAREISTKMSALGFASEIDIDRWCGKSVTSPSAPGPALEKALARHSELKLLLEMAREEPWPGGGAPGGIESIKSTAHSHKSSP